MPQSDGNNTLKRMEFEFKGTAFQFNLNPEEYTQDEPSRSTVTQTKGGAWIDDFGGGLRSIFIKGSTGMKNGYSKFVELRNLLRSYYDNVSPGDTVVDELTFHNYTDEESFIVHPDPSGFKLFRSKSNPLMYMYEVRLTVLRLASEPAPGTTTKAEITTQESAEPNSPVLTASFGNSGIAPVQMVTFAATQGVQILNSGQVQINELDRGVMTLMKSFSAVLPFDDSNEHTDMINPKLNPHVSNLTLDLYREFLAGTAETTDRTIPKESFLYRVMYDIPPTLLENDVEDTLKMIILDAFATHRAYKKDREAFSKRVSQGDIQNLIRNIRWLTVRLGEYDEPVLFDIISDLRKMEIELGEIKNYTPLFNQAVSKSLEQYNELRG